MPRRPSKYFRARRPAAKPARRKLRRKPLLPRGGARELVSRMFVSWQASLLAKAILHRRLSPSYAFYSRSMNRGSTADRGGVKKMVVSQFDQLRHFPEELRPDAGGEVRY